MKKKKRKLKIDLAKQIKGMENARKILEIPIVDRFMNRITCKLPEGEDKALLQNKAVQELLLGNILNSLGITKVEFKK